jgi:hypothetical protein
MATAVSYNGTTYTIPSSGEEDYAGTTKVDGYLIALATGSLPKSGGLFTLTAEVDFGVDYGLKSVYYKSRGTVSSTGILRLASGEAVSWRNNANTADLALTASSSDRLQFGGVNLPTISSTDTLTNKTISGSSNTLSNIAYAALVLTNSIVAADIAATAAIPYSKLSLAASILSSDMSSGAATSGTVLTANGSGGASWAIPNRNFIINGNFDFWQRGTSFAAVTNNQYVADRFSHRRSGMTAVYTLSRDTDVPTLAQSGVQSTYSLKLACTTAQASLSAGDWWAIQHRIEGYDYALLKNRQVTLSFWVKAFKTGTYCIAFHNSASDRSYISEYTINASNTWEQKNITVTVNPSGGTDDFANGIGLRVIWTLAAHSGFQTAPGSWSASGYMSSSNQVNGVDSTSNNFWLALVSLNVGSSAPTFTRAGGCIGKELALCQRYYEQSYDIGTVPAAVTATGCVDYTSRAADGLDRITIPFRATKRTAPTLTVYSAGGTGIASKFRDVTASSDLAATTANGGMSGFTAYPTAATTSGHEYQFHWTADAEL